MFTHNGSVLKEVRIEKRGFNESNFFCWYRYKEECEPECNKIKYPNPEDRWYEDYIYLSDIYRAKLSGAKVTSDIPMTWNEKTKEFIFD